MDTPVFLSFYQNVHFSGKKMFVLYSLLYPNYPKACLTQRRHLINVGWLNAQSRCVTGQHQPPWSRSCPSETPSVQNSKWRKICTKKCLNPQWFHSVCSKEPSNDAHQAITAEQMAFFSTQFIYKRLGNEAILEVSHLGGGGRLAPVTVWSNYVFCTQGERRWYNEEAPGSGRRLSSLNFLSPDFESTSVQSLGQPICQRTATQIPEEGLPAVLRGQESPLTCWGCLPEMLSILLQPVQHIYKG